MATKPKSKKVEKVEKVEVEAEKVEEVEVEAPLLVSKPAQAKPTLGDAARAEAIALMRDDPYPFRDITIMARPGIRRLVDPDSKAVYSDNRRVAVAKVSRSSWTYQQILAGILIAEEAE